MDAAAGPGPIDGVDYTRLPRDPPASTTRPPPPPATAAVGSQLPDGWPPEVPSPGADGWPDKAVDWLPDEAMPPDYRKHRDVLAKHPLQSARSAYEHTVRDAVRERYRGAAVDLREQLPPEAITAVLEVRRAELARLAERQQAIEHVGRATGHHVVSYAAPACHRRLGADEDQLVGWSASVPGRRSAGERVTAGSSWPMLPWRSSPAGRPLVWGG
ncbi:hypothetical protein [Nonomuraea endophytica]|uniref:Uncharacterized protein n=1 Tax=Nonomuraea endophytica TaxID=714136 RepID=A0A7W7ZYT8_9ACTN|nr:hypothetical protein [Nonomuraea endophytica]MBB5076351.1 hypothetical protein [Nonomuraea endophytica]